MLTGRAAGGDHRPDRVRRDAEALGQEHIRTLRAVGTPEWRIRYLHALRYASVPVVSVLGIQFIALFGGSVFVENVFAMAGLGQPARPLRSATTSRC